MLKEVPQDMFLIFTIVFIKSHFFFLKISYITTKHPINPPILFPNPNKIENAEVFRKKLSRVILNIEKRN